MTFSSSSPAPVRSLSRYGFVNVPTFLVFQSTGYVHWLGKGEVGQPEWVFRMYNQSTTGDPPRPNRISFYVFNAGGGEGIGSYFQEPVQVNETNPDRAISGFLSANHSFSLNSNLSQG